MLRQQPWWRKGFQGYRRAFGGLPSIMWKWKDNPIVLHTACLASHQADVFGMQQHSWQSNSRWWTPNVRCHGQCLPSLFRKQHGWLATSLQQLWPARWPPTGQTLADVKSRHVSTPTSSSTPLTEAYNHYSLSSPNDIPAVTHSPFIWPGAYVDAQGIVTCPVHW